jgi:hypothetical protein
MKKGIPAAARKKLTEFVDPFFLFEKSTALRFNEYDVFCRVLTYCSSSKPTPVSG